MRKQKGRNMKPLFATLSMVGFGLFTASFSGTASFDTLTFQLKLKTDEVVQLKAENAELKTKISFLEADILDRKIASIPIDYFAEVGYFEKDNPFARDPAYLRRIWSYCKKYRSLLTPEAEKVAKDANIIPEYFVFVWPGKESHYNPFCVGANKDSFGRITSYDYGISQINGGTRKDPLTGLSSPSMDAWNYGFAQLPAELRNRKGDPTKDPEIGIAMLYIWINDRVRYGWAWAYLNDWTWYLYWRIKETAKAENRVAISK